MKLLKRAAHHAKLGVFPHPDNGHLPHVLKEGAVWALIAIVMGIFAFSTVGTRVIRNGSFTAEVYPSVLVDLTNKDRREAALPTLAISNTLEAAAQLKANDMAAKSYFSHTSPEGVTPWHWFQAAGYNFIYAGENLAVNFEDSLPVQDAWLNSPTHRANIMSTKFTEIGIATARGMYKGRETTFVVELFGMPAIAAEEPVPAISAPPAQNISIPTPNEAGTIAGIEEEQKTEPAVRAKTTPTIAVTKEDPQYIEAVNESTNIVPVIAVPDNGEAKSSLWQRIVANPRGFVIPLYILIVAVILLAMIGIVLREYEQHHKKHMAYGMLLIVIISALSYIGSTALFPTLT